PFVALPIWLAWWTSWLRLRKRPTRLRRVRSRDSCVAVAPAERRGEERDEDAVKARHVALPRCVFPDLGEREVRRAHAVAIELMPVVASTDRLGGPLGPRHELGEQALNFVAGRAGGILVAEAHIAVGILRGEQLATEGRDPPAEC